MNRGSIGVNNTVFHIDLFSNKSNSFYQNVNMKNLVSISNTGVQIETTRSFFNKGHPESLSTRVPYFRQKFQYSCPIKCPLINADQMSFIEGL